ncbi:ABC transporter substrate-binding protein [Nitrosopumilus sp.]|uniref:ABC transporter substrate-binding protein n=1 Tax=Nitrosopumilus sp. TaxID=2024843 RepID=UPI003D0E323C
MSFTLVDVYGQSDNESSSEIVVCSEDYELVFKPSGDSSICVKSSSVENFLKRGYTLPTTTQENLRVGLLFSTSGDYSTYGTESQHAALMAIDDFNEYLKYIENEQTLLIPEVVSLQTDPEHTLEQVKKMHLDGVDVFIGPETSAELEFMKSYVDSEGLLVISTSSTAPSLAIEDNIFRLVPDDTHQTRLLALLAESAGSPTVFLLVRDDTWGNEFANAFDESYSGDVFMIRYDPVSPLYEQTLQQLSESIAAEMNPSEMNPSDVRVGMIGFGESAEFLSRATQFDILDDVRWFGTDSNANEKKIIENEKAVEFAQNVSFRALQFSTDTESTAYQEIETKIFGKLGHLPDTYAFTAYDAVWILGLSMLNAASTNPNDLALEIPSTITSYNGALGKLELNDAGDLVSDNYAIWSIVDGVWYKGNYAKNMESGLIELVETDLEELATEETILEKSAPIDDNEIPIEQTSITDDEIPITQTSVADDELSILVNLLIALIIGVSAIAGFTIWKLRTLSIKLKNSVHIQKIEPEPTPEPEPEPTPEPEPEPTPEPEPEPTPEPEPEPTPEPEPEPTPEPEPEPTPEPVEPKNAVKLLSSKEILQKCIQTHSTLMTDKEIDFSDSSIKNVKFVSNEKPILEIFSNLIRASHHLVGSYGQIEIGVNDDEDITFFVKDNGNGISKEEQEKVFDEDDGPLGLMTTKEIVQDMGGKIWIESVSFLGTAFYFSIPIHPNS